MTISELQEGERFKLAALPDRVGTLLRIGAGSATVRYDGVVHRKVSIRKGEETAEFDQPHKPRTISLATEVERVACSTCRSAGAR